MPTRRELIGFAAGLVAMLCLTYPLRAWTTTCVLEDADERGYELVEASDADGQPVEPAVYGIGWNEAVRIEAGHNGVGVDGVGPEGNLPLWLQPRISSFARVEKRIGR